LLHDPEPASEPDVIVLDLRMPVADGLEVTHCARSSGLETPILILTARRDVFDRVAALDLGADDYIVKPFAFEELLARIRALLRRVAGPRREPLRVADLELDAGAHEVYRGDRTIQLTRTEFALLELLMRNAGQVLPRSLIYDRVWGYAFEQDSHTLEVYVGYLRRKTELGGAARLIHTVRGLGYTIREP
jgi:two-component system response regulator MprA